MRAAEAYGKKGADSRSSLPKLLQCKSPKVKVKVKCYNITQYNLKTQKSHDYVESEALGYKLLGARDAYSREKVSF